MDMKKPVKVTFAEGCFDNFEGSQEELDDLVNQITTMFSTMSREEIEAKSHQIDLDEIMEELSDDPELLEILQNMPDVDNRKLH